MLSNNSETNRWNLCLSMLKQSSIVEGTRLTRSNWWGHALQVCQMSTRYLEKQIIYGLRNTTNLFKL